MKQHARRVAQSTKVRFASIGVINTLIDFTLLNLLVHGLGLPRIPANVVSASVAMTFSFAANRTIVFKAKDGNARRQAFLFVLVTMTSIYGLQNLVIFILTDLWTWPLDTAYEMVGILDPEVFVTNAAKVAATLASLVWNYVFYKHVVFKDERQ